VIYLDTNILLRIITQDIPEQAEQAFAQIAASKRGECVVLASVLVEVTFVLQYHDYQMKKSDIAAALLDLLADDRIAAEDSALVPAIELYGTTPKLDFVDCLLAVKARHRKSGVLTFDKDLARQLNR